MQSTPLLVLSLLLLFPVMVVSEEVNPTEKPASDTNQWVDIFNGKDLTGWTPKFTGYELGENHANTFRVEDGLLKVRYDGYSTFDNAFGHLFYNTPYSHYRIRAEYRFIGDQCKGGPGWGFRNSGLMIHGQTAESMKKDQFFPASIEVQIVGGDGKSNRPNNNLCTPGTTVEMDGKRTYAHCIGSSAKTYHGDQWVTVEIEVHGNEVIRHISEGKVVLEYQKPQLDNGTALDSGTISLQAESHPIDFRKIQIMELDK